MRLFTAVTFALTILLVTSTVGAVAITAPLPEPTPSVNDRYPSEPASSTIQEQQSQLSALSAQSEPSANDPKQVIRIDVRDNGDARWTIESRFLLTDGDDVESFNEFATAVTAGERDVAYDRQWFERQATDAEAATDRSMSIENAGWDEPRIEELEDDDISPDEIDDEETAHVGIISYSVTWTNFATVDDNRIYFGDAFQTDNPWFPALWDGQHLEIESPPDYALETPTQLEWTGPYQFGEDELQIIFVRSGGDSTSVAGSVVSGWMIGGIVVLLFLVGAGSYLFARRGPETDLPAPVDRIPDRAAALGIAAHVAQLRSRVRAQLGREQQQPATTDTNGSTVQSAPGTASDADGADRRSGATGTRLEYEEESDDEIDLELLSDEERVLRMLTRNGGRMKQASIVKETGWSNAKVSQLLSQMDDDEEIEKLRIGRENLITLPEVDPTELD